MEVDVSCRVAGGCECTQSRWEKREKWDSKKFECYGRLVKLLLPFVHGKHACTAPYTIHTAHAVLRDIAIYTSTSMPPAGSREPAIGSVLLSQI
jgi:hypothetical protein